MDSWGRQASSQLISGTINAANRDSQSFRAYRPEQRAAPNSSRIGN